MSAIENAFVVFGPPGCAKTTYVANQVAEAAYARGPENVMVTSFTRAAAAELTGRGLPIPKNNVGTLHAICYHALGMPTIAETKVAEWNLDNPGMALTDEKADRGHDDYYGGNDAPIGDRLFAAYQLARARMRTDLMSTQVTRFADRWENWKAENEYVDFTDMIDLCRKLVPKAPGNPSIMFVDEAQDLNALQMNLIHKWGAHMDRYIVCGDPDQCIFSFTGASPDAFMSGDVAADHKRVLSQSYRVPRKVQELASHWIEQIKDREPTEYRPRDVEGEVRVASNLQYQTAAPIIDDMERYLRDGKTVMLLTTCAYMLNPIKAGLRAAGIPFHNPYRRVRADWNPLTPSRGVAARERLLAYLRPSEAVWGDEARLWTGEDLALWTQPLSKKIWQKGQEKNAATLDPADTATMTQLYAWLDNEKLRGALSGRLDWYRAMLTESTRPRFEFPLKIAEQTGAAALKGTPQCILGTTHSVKGGESDVVYLFPDLSPQAEMARQQPGGNDALTRLMYVGMTRARESLILTGASGRFAVHIPTPSRSRAR